MSAITRINAGHVASEVETRFGSLVDVSDVSIASAGQRGMATKTRGLAAYSLASLVTGLSDEIAAKHVTDGTGDCGIDALYVDEESKTIYVVQSKWHEGGTGSIGLGDIRNTIAGIKYLTDEQYDRFNSKFRHIIPSIEQAFTDVDFSFELIIVVTGASVLADEVQNAVTDLCTEMNEISEVIKIRLLGLRELRRILTDGTGASIDLNATLVGWGSLSEPYTAYYGLIDAPTVADWYTSHGGRLFDQNLRKALGPTSVNSSLVRTLTREPQHFWYFNNGITALCTRVTKTARGGSNRLSGDFRIEGLSIVNGAQTVSSIAAAYSSDPETVANANVWIRLISLEDVPDGFAAEVTRTTNTQNTVEARDFMSLDPEQARLRTDMWLSLKRSYVYKRGETAPQPDQGCTSQEALIALACGQPDSSFAVLAKSNLGRLEDPDGRYYPQLFGPNRTVHEMWNSVEIYRQVEKILGGLRATLTGRERAIVQQGNRIITHAVMKRLGGLENIGTDDSKALEHALKQVPGLAAQCSVILFDAVQDLYPANYVTSLFKNAARCAELAEIVEATASTTTPK